MGYTINNGKTPDQNNLCTFRKESNMKLNIGQNIRALRRAKDMTQDELAAKLGVTYQSVAHILTWSCSPLFPTCSV